MNRPRTGSCTGRISGWGWLGGAAAGWPTRFALSAMLSSIVFHVASVYRSILVLNCVNEQLYFGVDCL
jgi:hypothetical protein